ncbi:MAG: bifunctional phosphoribosyl-AMP cyclohydrolase/phosphoribosyl-ATP diphosphatase HisIE [Candidatus Tyrphobacter sp.]
MDLNDVVFDERGLVPVVMADALTGDVLTLAWANREALQRTIATQQTHLFSRKRGLWRKGEESGNVQRVTDVVVDCDGDAVLYRVVPSGPACHTGEQSCFHHSVFAADEGVRDGAFFRAVLHLQRVLVQRKEAAPEGSYVAKLYAGGVDRIGKKVGEEATEVVIAAKNDDDGALVWEAADLIFHLMVLLEVRGVALNDVGEQLLQRGR